MKKTITLLALFLSTFAFSQTFKKAIISDSAHTYDLVKNLSCRIVRAIPSKGGVQFSDNDLTVYVVVYGINEEGELFNLPQFSEKITYTKV